MRTIITMRADVPELKGFKLNETAISDGMLRGWYKAGPHGTHGGLSPRTESKSFGPRRKSIPAQLGNTKNITINGDGKADVSAIGYVPGPHASIQDQGGVIPPRSAIRRSRMKFVWHGMLMFAKHLGPSRIKPKQYIVRGLREVALAANLVVEGVWVRKLVDK